MQPRPAIIGSPAAQGFLPPSVGTTDFARPLSAARVADYLTFFAPVLYCVRFHLVGDLFGTDVILLTAFPILLVNRGRLLRSSEPIWFLVLGLLWLVAQIFTDLVVGSTSRECMRGWSMIAFTIIEFSTLYMLLWRSPKRIALFAVGWLVGSGLMLLLGPYEHLAGGNWLSATEADPWKFGVGTPVTIVAALVIGYYFRGSRRNAGLALLVLAMFSIVMASRSLGGSTMLAAILMFVRPRRAGSWAKLHHSLGLSLVLLIGTVTTMQLYGYAALHGMLGNGARYEYELQSSGRYGVLVGARTESFVALQAIADSPWIGHGSWAKDARYVVEMYLLRLRAGYLNGVNVKPLTDDDLAEIPSHSIILGSWVDAGILAVPFWAWIMILAFRALFKVSRSTGPLAAMVAVTVMLLVWDILFSPFGAERRFLTSYMIIVVMCSLQNSACEMRLTTEGQNRRGMSPGI